MMRAVSGVALGALVVASACVRAKPSDSTAAAAGTAITAPPLEISLAHGSLAEQATRAQLLRLAERYDLSRWLLTRTVAIDEGAIPHSHPILTLHTRHQKSDEQLLSTFIHEQMHWYLDLHRQDTDDAVADLRLAFPTVPVGFPEGADNERSSYEHLIVIFLEYDGLSALVGPGRAESTFDFWQDDHYRSLYRLVRANQNRIEALAVRHHLYPYRALRGFE